MKFRFRLQEILLTILVVLNLLLVNMPLTNIIGYEFSALNGIFLFFLFGIATIKVAKIKLLENFIGVIHSLKYFTILALSIPLIIILISTIFFSNCPFLDGIQFYFVITIPSAFFGAILGIFISSHSRKFQYIIFVIIFIIILFYPLIEFYFNPQIYFYNIIFGFLPGTIYDEDLTVDTLLVSFRLLNIAYFIGLLLLSDSVLKGKLKKVKSISIAVIIICIFILLKPLLGYSTDLRRIQHSLDGKVSTEHFEIYYPKNIADKKSIELLALLHEYYYEEVHRSLQVRSKQKITSFIFQNENQKRVLFGSGKADVAKPWLNQIYIDFPNYQETLKHEIVHVLASEFGATPFLVADRINPALIEGLAMAIENDYDDYPIHYYAAIGIQTKHQVEIKNLFEGLSFFSRSSTMSYLYAGSFIKYLIDNYGIEKAKRLYSNLDFDVVYKTDIVQLQKDYYDFIKTLDIAFNQDKAQLHFAGQPIFKKYCARVAAVETKKAWNLFYNKDYNSALNLFDEVYNYSYSYQALLGRINCLLKLNQIGISDSLITAEINKFYESPYFYNLELIAGDVKIQNGRIDEAKKYYDSLLVQNPHVAYYNNIVTRNRFLTISSDSIYNFIEGNENKKIEMLINLNEKEIVYESIPLIVNFASRIKQVENVLDKLADRVEVTDFNSSYAAFSISKAAFSVNKFLLAKELAIKALQYKSDIFFTETLTKNLKMINWIINFDEEAKKQIRYQ